MADEPKPKPKWDWDAFFKALVTFIIIALLFIICMGLGPKAFVQKMMFSF